MPFHQLIGLFVYQSHCLSVSHLWSNLNIQKELEKAHESILYHFEMLVCKAVFKENNLCKMLLWWKPLRRLMLYSTFHQQLLYSLILNSCFCADSQLEQCGGAGAETAFAHSDGGVRHWSSKGGSSSAGISQCTHHHPYPHPHQWHRGRPAPWAARHQSRPPCQQ